MLNSVLGCPANRVRWCGPSAISAMTGIDYMTALETIRQDRLRRHRINGYEKRVIVKGVYHDEMNRALERLGYRMTPVSFTKGITFARFLRERTPEQRKSMILVCAGNHYMATMGNKAVDGIVKDPVFISKMTGRRKRMEKAWRVVKIAEPKMRVAKITAEKMVLTAERKVALAESGRLYRRAKTLATKLGLTIESRGQDEFEVMAKDGYLIDDITGRMFSGRDRWEGAVEWMEYLDANGVEQEVNPDDVSED